MSSAYAYHAKPQAKFEATIRRYDVGRKTEWFTFNITADHSGWIDSIKEFVHDCGEVTLFMSPEQLESLMHAINTAYMETMNPDMVSAE